jgi:hypothetical protein
MGVAKSAADLPVRRKGRRALPSDVNLVSFPSSDPAEIPGLGAEQSASDVDNIGGRKWSRLQTVVFVVVASAALWGAIGYTISRLLSR